ncbi:MAG TPA: beta-ketoacyl-[acyl-carrier-protein] synthase family protein [Terriglobales bacterium]|nr:beta-ketoacyl-[acyl-carrier-protein] synthase family protein [Terriglobales bacterium]
MSAPARAYGCVITGAGVVSPLGLGLEATRAALRRGQSGIGPIRGFDTRGFPVNCAGEVDEPGLEGGARRPEAMAELALDEALAQAGLERPAAGGALDPRRAVSFAVGKPTLDLEGLARRRGDWAAACEPAQLLRRLPEIEQQRAAADPSAVLRRLARRSGAGGGLYSSYTACASGNDAIGLGKRLIERGEADLVIAGATDAQVHPLSLLEFELLSALSHEPAERACRPFDRERTGFVVGEGAAVVILEEAGHARRRQARVRAQLAGYGSSLDCYGLTKCHPQGRGAALAIRAALADAALAPADIDYLNAHGTGTVLNDQAEAAAIRQVWGADTARLPVSSTKAMTGHLLTAASAVEAVITLLALEEGLLPPNLNYQHRDPDCDLHLVIHPGARAPLRTAMSNGFGFGGQNSSLILQAATA